MPIRINLLAEAQAEEELRRKDPIKRCILASSLVVLSVLVWIAILQVRIMSQSSTLNRLQSQIDEHQDDFDVVKSSLDETVKINGKLGALTQLATNRFLNGNLMQALQSTTVADVNLLRLRLNQSFAITEAVKARTNASSVIPGKPATSTEKIELILEARDASLNPGNEQVNKYKETLAGYDFFASNFGEPAAWRLVNLAPPQQTEDMSRPFVLFTLECKLPEVTR
jgi:hypothetical protein